MNIKTELLSSRIAEIIKDNISSLSIDADKITDTAAICALDKIKSVINKNLSDFETVDKIVDILKSCNIDTGACHNQFYLIDQAAKESEKLAATRMLNR